VKRTAATAMAMALVLVAEPGRLLAGPLDAGRKQLSRDIGKAGSALARGAPEVAVRHAEAAVLRSPREAQARAMLGRAYLAAGRFRSAETALGDALALDPSLVRAAVNRAIAQIALGHAEAAGATLEAVRDRAGASDVGLALALLGRMAEARALLLSAARAPGADARTRQNLAFAYAIEGRWNDAATIAAQDVPAELIPERLRRWAMVGQLRTSPAMQVGALLGTLPAADDGQPAALALVTEPVVLAGLVAPPAEPPLVVPPPVLLARQRDGALFARAPEAEPDRARLGAEPVRPFDAVAFSGPPVMRASRRAAPGKVAPPRSTTSAPSLLRIALPVRPFVAASRPKWAVQLGAYVDPDRVERAWSRLSVRATFLQAYLPTGSGFRRGGTLFHRLSIGGLNRRGDAVRLCTRIRRSGGQCFIRVDVGERPLRWAVRARVGQAV